MYCTAVLSALQFIDNATQTEPISLIQSLEQDNQTNYANSWFYSAAVQRWAEPESQAVVEYMAQQHGFIPNDRAHCDADR